MSFFNTMTKTIGEIKGISGKAMSDPIVGAALKKAGVGAAIGGGAGLVKSIASGDGTPVGDTIKGGLLGGVVGGGMGAFSGAGGIKGIKSLMAGKSAAEEVVSAAASIPAAGEAGFVGPLSQRQILNGHISSTKEEMLNLLEKGSGASKEEQRRLDQLRARMKVFRENEKGL